MWRRPHFRQEARNWEGSWASPDLLQLYLGTWLTPVLWHQSSGCFYISQYIYRARPPFSSSKAKLRKKPPATEVNAYPTSTRDFECYKLLQYIPEFTVRSRSQYGVLFIGIYFSSQTQAIPQQGGGLANYSTNIFLTKNRVLHENTIFELPVENLSFRHWR